MHRREFLIRLGGGLVAVPFVLEVIGCGSEDAAGPGPAPADGFTVTNSDNSGHGHSFAIQCSQLGSATAIPFTATGGHTHRVELSAADLATIAAGGEVRKDTNDTHPHTWIIRKPSGVC